jgi:ADP-ribosyl-[dinitrogen reductase] hydrolase
VAEGIDWTDVERRALGAYLGFAVGDALGATVQFMSADEIATAYGVHHNLRGGGWLKLRAGQVTDDTEMCLALGRAIVDGGGFDAATAAEALTAWLLGKPTDVDHTCRRGLRRYLGDHSVSAPPNAGDAGASAAVRTLPVALASLGDPAALEHWSAAQCHLTHNHALSDGAALALGRITHALLAGGGHKAARAEANRLIAAQPAFKFQPYPGHAGARVVETLQTVLHAYFRNDSVEHCVIEVVNRGENADTTGALAGMLAGATYGVEGIPRRWLGRLDSAVKSAIETQVPALLGVARRRLAQRPDGYPAE